MWGITRSAILTAVILFLAAILPAGYFYWNGLSKGKVDAYAEKDRTASGETLIIARAKSGMKQGQQLDASSIDMVEVPAELVPKGAVTSLARLNDMRLKRDVAEKEFLNALDFMTGSTTFEEGDRLIEHNFAEGAVPAEVVDGSTIDIKLFVKGEADRVVVSKITVVSRSGSLLSFYMNEQEQEFIKEAATEGLLFAVQYVDDSQSASTVTYVPSYSKQRGE
jgi:hypothetical protein